MKSRFILMKMHLRFTACSHHKPDTKDAKTNASENYLSGTI